jgi:hypothetical protein
MKYVLVLLALSACAPATLPLGAQCKADADCDSGLTCQALGQFNGPQCTNVGSVCTETCTSDADCTKLDAGAKCFATCTAGKEVCGLTG